MSINTTAARLVALIPDMAKDTAANNEQLILNILNESVVDKGRFEVAAGGALKMAARIAELEARPDAAASMKMLAEANELLRSAWQIANRGGKETDWPAWRAKLEESLKRQHDALHPNPE